jgi:hypothetical protein
MKSFSTSLIAALLIGSLGLAGSAFACGGGGNGGNHNRNNQNCNNGGYNNGGYDPYDNNFGQAYEPFHSTYICQPGDSFYEVALKEYGTSAPMKYIAKYNRMATNAALVPGRKLYLPMISSGGRMTASRAPAAEAFATSPYSTSPYATSPYTMPAANFAQPATTIAAPAPVASEPERMSVPTGSTLQLDGEKLGSDAGVVRLRISNVALPVEVIEWSADSTKIRLPKVDVTEATKAELEVVRADGTLASTNAISLTSAATSVAAN